MADAKDSIFSLVPLALGDRGHVLPTGPDDRRLVIPLQAIALNVLNLGAVFGAMVWIFQDGHGADLLLISRIAEEFHAMLLDATLVRSVLVGAATAVPASWHVRSRRLSNACRS